MQRRSACKGLPFLRTAGFVSVGGGSVMDTAKAANLYSTFPDEFLAYVNAPIGKAEPVPGPLKPHIACPTTFGTASECTGIAVFDLLEMASKTGIAGPRLRPSLGILDPANLSTLPKEILAANGFNVFSHSVESITARPFTHRPAPPRPSERPLSQGANPYSDINCLGGVGYSDQDLDALTDKAFPQKRLLDNAPLPIDRNQLKALFKDALAYW